MPQYIMPINTRTARVRFQALDAFTQAYIEAALWVGLAEDEEIERFGGTHRAAFNDLAPRAVTVLAADCADFQQCNAALLAAWGDDTGAGHDFWLTRNRHGAGFWDRGRGKLGDQLTTAAHAYGEVYLYVGNDGRIYAN